jgi:hypothetical protein
MELFEYHRELRDAPSYAVRSSVPRDSFESFVASLKAGKKISVASGNSASLALLAKGFFLPELAAECADFAGEKEARARRMFQMMTNCLGGSRVASKDESR